MRIAFYGLSDITVKTAELLIEDGHEVIIMEADQKKIDDVSDKLDCSFLHGEGSRPDILREVNPEKTDILFCLSDNDQNNMIAGLVGRSLGIKRIVLRIEDPHLEKVCLELGLEDIIIPSSTVSRYLKDSIVGKGVAEMSTVIKDEARFFTFIAGKDDAVPIKDLNLPNEAKVICYYRDSKFFQAEEDTRLQEDDEVVILTHSKNLPELKEKWQTKS